MLKHTSMNRNEAFMHCDKNKLAKEFAAMYSDNEEQAAAVKEVDTRFEEAQRFFDENKEPQIGFSIEDIAKKLLGDDYTEDWYPEEEQERDRRNMVISSYIALTTAALFWWVDG